MHWPYKNRWGAGFGGCSLPVLFQTTFPATLQTAFSPCLPHKHPTPQLAPPKIKLIALVKSALPENLISVPLGMVGQKKGQRNHCCSHAGLLKLLTPAKHIPAFSRLLPYPSPLHRKLL